MMRDRLRVALLNDLEPRHRLAIAAAVLPVVERVVGAIHEQG
jgi:hypothetical protein